MNERELERPLNGSPDETDISLRASFNRLGQARLREYFRADGSLMLGCCERDVEIDEYRAVLEEQLARLWSAGDELDLGRE